MINRQIEISLNLLSGVKRSLWAVYSFFSSQKLRLLLDPYVYLQHGHPGLRCHVLLSVNCREIQKDWKPQGMWKSAFSKNLLYYEYVNGYELISDWSWHSICNFHINTEADMLTFVSVDPNPNIISCMIQGKSKNPIVASNVSNY